MYHQLLNDINALLSDITTLFIDMAGTIRSTKYATFVESHMDTIGLVMTTIGILTIFEFLIYVLTDYGIGFIKKQSKNQLKAQREHKRKLDIAWGKLFKEDPDAFDDYPIFKKEYPHHYKAVMGQKPRQKPAGGYRRY